MKAKELIEMLEKMQKEHPDADVCIPEYYSLWNEDFKSYEPSHIDKKVVTVMMHGKNIVILDEEQKGYLFEICWKCGKPTIKYSRRGEKGRTAIAKCPNCYDKEQNDAEYEHEARNWLD